jgi:hypothetical protein
MAAMMIGAAAAAAAAAECVVVVDVAAAAAGAAGGAAAVGAAAAAQTQALATFPRLLPVPLLPPLAPPHCRLHGCFGCEQPRALQPAASLTHKGGVVVSNGGFKGRTTRAFGQDGAESSRGGGNKRRRARKRRVWQAQALPKTHLQRPNPNLLHLPAHKRIEIGIPVHK